MNTIRVMRDGRPATDEELQAAVEGRPLPPSDCSPPAVKPPLGVMPEDIWHWKRCHELSRAIYEYFEAGMIPRQKWMDELARRFPKANAEAE